MNGYRGGKGEREKGSCGEGEKADGYGRRGVDGWARPHRRRCWARPRRCSARLGSARRRPRGCVCVNVRGRVRDREK
ncbi:hypothetical protein CMV_013704 [Castanea mollissima]|uniref:Uncharacterized protein n=1 Tax=Castanea mollissima TaxID=60419 RepID=A0A8J4VUN0_9ROSI|nr:hypothetical protein CMV_013704 [Castanea mollissima]